MNLPVLHDTSWSVLIFISNLIVKIKLSISIFLQSSYLVCLVHIFFSWIPNLIILEKQIWSKLKVVLLLWTQYSMFGKKEEKNWYVFLNINWMLRVLLYCKKIGDSISRMTIFVILFVRHVLQNYLMKEILPHWSCAEKTSLINIFLNT